MKALSLVFGLAVLSSAFSAANNPVDKTSSQQIVKVGYYESANFQNGAQEGAVKSGYSYDYLQEISYYTGWKYEYVYGDWSTLLSALQNGTIDVMGGVSYTTERAETLLYQATPMGHEYYYIYQPNNRSDVVAGDYASYLGKTIGTMENSVMTTMLQEWVAEHSVDVVIKTYPSFELRDEALENGEIDLLVNTDNNVFQETALLPLDKIGESPYYLASPKTNASLMEQIDEAMEEILAANPNFQQNLQDKYFGNTAVSRALSDEEKVWLAAHPSVKIGYLENYLPYSGKDKDGNVTGLVKELIPELFGNLSLERPLSFEFKSYSSYRDMVESAKNNDTDLVFPVGGGAYYSEINGLYSSDKVIAASMSLVYSGSFDNSKTGVLAVNVNNEMQRYFTQSEYPNARILEVNSVEECLNAVKNGLATGTVINGLRVSALLSNSRYSSLHNAPLVHTDDRCIGVPSGETVLLHLVNHALGILDSSFATTVSYRYLSGLVSYTFDDFLNDNIALVVTVGVSVTFLIIISLVLLLLGFRRSARKERQRKEELATALDAAEAASKAKTVFLSSMSHDIRTPMNAIIGFSDLAKSNLNDPEVVGDYLQKISTSSHHLLLLINDVLDMSRIESGRMNLVYSSIHIPDLLKDLNDVVGSDVASKQLRFSIEKETEHDDIVGDRLRLNQIFLNCVGNAVKFTPPGGTIVVKVKEETSMDEKIHLIFSFADSGIGMSDEFQKHIFEPFTRENTSTVSGIPGSGLGMAITKNIVTMMGGDISVSSVLGKGTTFEIRLSFAESKGAAQVDKQIQCAQEKDYQGKRILLVEDNDLNREITIAMLEPFNFQIDQAENGKAGLDLFERTQCGYYSLILMDIQMPVMDGLEATKQIRALQREDAKNIPIIALTANAFAEDVSKCKEAGMNSHVSKPFSAEKLRAAISKFL